VDLVGVIASIVAACAASLTLGLTLWWRRPSLEVDFRAAPGIAGERGRAYDAKIHNTGSTTVKVWASLHLDGSRIGAEIGPLRLVPPLHRSLTLTVPSQFGDRPPTLRLRYGWRRSIEIEHGQRVSI
jgi:hypothetical protein